MMSMGIEGYNKTVSSTSAVAPTIDVSNLFTHTYDKKVNYQGTGPGEVDDLSIDLDKYMDIEITYTPKEEVPWYEAALNAVGEFLGDVGEVFVSTGATVAVAYTSVVSGVLDVGEGIFDGATWLAATGADILGFDDAASGMREFISRDLVSEANEEFYENTTLGRFINDSSYMKYDSKVAQGIRSVSETATTFIAATALTVGTGGAASFTLGAATIPTATVTAGFLSSAGNKAEEIYQETGANTTLGKEAQIFLSGAGGAASWYFQGQAGSKAYEAIKDGTFKTAVGDSVQSGRTALTNAKTKLNTAFTNVKTSIQNDGLKTTLKNGASSAWSTTKAGGRRILNDIKSGGAEIVKEDIFDVGDNIEFITENAGDFVGGDRDFTLDALAAVGTEWATDKVVDIIGDSENNVIDDFLDDVDDGLDRAGTHALRERLIIEKPVATKVVDGMETIATAAQEDLKEDTTIIDTYPTDTNENPTGVVYV